MRGLTRKVSIFWLYPFIVFALICFVPWWEGKGGPKLPIATGYEYQFIGWQFVLLCHLAATIVLSLVMIGLHLWIRPFINADRSRETQSTRDIE